MPFPIRPARSRPRTAPTITTVGAILVVLAFLPGPAAGSPLAAEEPLPAAYELEVAIVPAEHALRGRADVRFPAGVANPDTIVFYLHGELAVDSLAIDGEPLPVSQTPVFYPYDYSLVARRVEAVLQGRKLSAGLTVWYSGHFHPSRARSRSDYMRIDQDGALLRSYGYSLWFPVFLDSGRDGHAADFPRVEITVPAEFAAVFAGDWLARERDGDLMRYRWRAENLDLFAAQLTARRFVTRSEENCTAWVLDDPEVLAAAARILDFSRRLDTIFRDRYRTGDPGRQLHLMQMPRFGDIASGNVIGIETGSWMEFDPESHSGRTIAHELVHDRVRVDVPRADPLFALAVEGFPSYFHLPVLGESLGDTFYDDIVSRIEQGYRQRRSSGNDSRGRPLPPEKPIYAIGPDEIGIYKDRFVLPDRVVLFFDALRRRLGPDRFTAFTRDLFAHDGLDCTSFEAIVLEHVPGFGPELHDWLVTTRYPVVEAGR
ncbi:MAG: hypothetical protein R6X25_07135 [Candidatus Krumholzibacteriia bacterium]